jgi:hypothetical protein
MIEARELRIGNFVDCERPLYDEKFITVESVSFDSINLNFREYELEKLQPIPLTEEWLLKFGFELETDDGDVKYYEIQRFWYYVIFDHGDVRLDIKTGKNITHTVFYMDERFQYVHQLQNLYFALTGEELTI